MAEKLWDLANYVTGFAIAQVIATTFAIANRQILALNGARAHWIALAITLVFTGFYITAIIWCGRKGRPLSPGVHSLWHSVDIGRVAAVSVFTLVLFLALSGHRLDEIKPEQSKPATTAPAASKTP